MFKKSILLLPVLVACSSAPKQPVHVSIEPQARVVAQVQVDRASARSANRNVVRQVYGKWVVDQSKCSVQTNPGQRVHVSAGEAWGGGRQIQMQPYHFNDEGIQSDGGRLTGYRFRLGRGEKDHPGGYGGKEHWVTTVTSNQISTDWAIRQTRDNGQPRDYFRTQQSLTVQGNRLLLVKAEEGEQAIRCEFVRPEYSESTFRSARRLANPKLEEIHALAKGFTAETDQMALEFAKAKYVKASGNLTSNELQEVLNLQMLPNIHTLVLEEISTPAKVNSSTNEALNKLIEYGRSQVQDGSAQASDYAALSQIKAKLRDLLRSQTHKAYYLNWGGGGDSMGDGIVIVDEQNKEVLYVGNGDYI